MNEDRKKKAFSAARIFLALNVFLIIPLYLGVMWNMFAEVRLNIKTDSPLTVTMSDPGIPSTKRVGGCAVGVEGVPAIRFTMAQPYRMGRLSLSFTGGPCAFRVDEYSYVRCRILQRFQDGVDFTRSFEADKGTRIEQRDDGVYVVLTGASGCVHPKDECFSWTGLRLTFASFSRKATVAFAALELLILAFSVFVTFLPCRKFTWSIALKQVGVAGLIAIYLAVLIPLQTAFQSAGEMNISVLSLVPSITFAFLVVMLDLVLLFWATYHRCGNFFPMIGVLVVVYEYIQTGLLSVGFPPLDGSLRFFENVALAWRDAGVMFALAALFFGCYKWIVPYRLWVVAAVIVMGGAGVLDAKKVEHTQTANSLPLPDEWNRSVDEIIESVRWSPRRNVILLIPDTVQADVSLDVVQKNPEIKARFAGFTGFSNNVGTHRFTIPSIPAMLTGVYHDGVESEDRSVARLKEPGSALWPYHTNNVPMSVLALVRYTNRRPLGPKEEPTESQPRAEVNSFLRRQSGIPYFNLNDVIAFRLSPFWMKASMIQLCNIGVGAGSRDRDDGALYPRLSLASVDPAISNNLVVIHTMGNHLPLHYDRHGGLHDRLPQNYETMFEQTYYVLDQIGRFLDVLKAKGVYDKSIIVIAADHGSDAAESRIMSGDKVIGRVVPMLWVKPIGAKGDFEPSFVPTAQINLHKIITASHDQDLTSGEVALMLREGGNRLWRHTMHGRTDELLIDASGHIVSERHFAQSETR